MERFSSDLKIEAGRPGAHPGGYMLLATLLNMPLTELPTETSTENAAIEMKNATIAYSIAVAPSSPSCFLKSVTINFLPRHCQ